MISYYYQYLYDCTASLNDAPSDDVARLKQAEERNLHDIGNLALTHHCVRKNAQAYAVEHNKQTSTQFRILSSINYESTLHCIFINKHYLFIPILIPLDY